MATREGGTGGHAGAKVSLHDRISFLMCIKEERKAVTFDHVKEKVTRDMTFLGEVEPTEAQYRESLASLVKEGLLAQDSKGFYRLPPLDAYARGFAGAMKNSLNRSYFLVYVAERYYPHVAEAMLPYLVDRPISAVKVFSGKKDPIREVDPIFVRYSKYKPRPVHLAVNDTSDVMGLVHDHCVDFVPYVHGFDGRPNVFLVDLDLGEGIASAPFALGFARDAAALVGDILSEAGCHPLIKFSGSRGFQVLCRMSSSGEAMGFERLREAVRAVQGELELRITEGEVGRRLASHGLDEPYTTSEVADRGARARRLLVDWSSMKPEGDYRAPFSLHHRTGLVSIPVSKADLASFTLEKADPLAMIENPTGLQLPETVPETTWDALTALLRGRN